MVKKKLFSEIVVIMDKSGSMWHARTDTIGGFNKFLSEQKKVPGKANLTLIQFNTSYNFTYNGVDIKDVVELNEDTYVPNGMTALLDSVGRGIIETEKRIKESDKKPDQVVFVIITDGCENSSREFTRVQIADMVKKKRNKSKWEFMFLGANIDSFGEAGSLGMSATTVSNYDIKNVHVAYSFMSDKISSYRSSNLGASLEFTDEERNNLTKDKDDDKEK